MSAIAKAKEAFDDLLDEYGFRLAKEEYQHEAFGSALLEYSRRGLRFRLIWDGRDGILSAAVTEVSGSGPASEWSDLEFLATGRLVSADEARVPDRVARLREVVDGYLASRSSKQSPK